MQKSTVLFSKIVKGYLVRLVSVQGSIYVNLFQPNGHFSSHRFASVLPAYAFISFLINKLKKI